MAVAPLPPPTPEELAARKLLINRELSWLEFNRRVLDEARDPSVPLLERLKFHCIFSSNLDEFYMVRVAGLKEQEKSALAPETTADGMSPQEQLIAISTRTHELVEAQYVDFRKQIVSGLKAASIELLRPKHLRPDEQAFVTRYFHEQVFPVLTPLAVDPGHPFPHLANKSLNCAITMKSRKRGSRGQIFGVVQVPSVLPRLIQLPAAAATEKQTRRLLLLEDVIAMHVTELFPDSAPTTCYPFRITRDSDIDVDEDEAVDLLQAIRLLNGPAPAAAIVEARCGSRSRSTTISPSCRRCAPRSRSSPPTCFAWPGR
jgi:polyphosphate kinase